MAKAADKKTWRVGELARRTGASVRTLHYYGEIGLLVPSARTASGHRVYDADDIVRLTRILSLRMLGFGLDAIRQSLDGSKNDPLEIVTRHLERLREQIAVEEKICERLERIARALRAERRPRTEDLLQTIEAMTMHEKYFTERQLETLKARREALGEGAIAASEKAWAALIADVRAAMAANADPASAEVQALARRWRELLQEFTGGDPAIEQSLKTMYRSEPSARTWSGLDEGVARFIARARSGPSATSAAPARRGRRGSPR